MFPRCCCDLAFLDRCHFWQILDMICLNCRNLKIFTRPCQKVGLSNKRREESILMFYNQLVEKWQSFKSSLLVAESVYLRIIIVNGLFHAGASFSVATCSSSFAVIIMFNSIKLERLTQSTGNALLIFERNASCGWKWQKVVTL